MYSLGLGILLGLGFLIILSYIIFIFKGKYSYSRWWFGLDKLYIGNINFLYIFLITSLLAIIGWCYSLWYFVVKLDEELEDNEKNKIFIEMIISFVASLFWAPLVYYSIKYKNNKITKNILKFLAAISLGISAGAAGAATYFMGYYGNDSIYRTLAIIGYSFYVFHTGFVDFGLWNLYYLKNH